MKMQATSVALNGKAYLITGEPGAGKSALALALIGRGATLISDDITEVVDGVALAPKKYAGWMEVRGIGLVSGFRVCPSAEVGAIIRLTPGKPDRIPIQKQGKIPEFQLWDQDKAQADKVLLIDSILEGKLRIESEKGDIK